MKRKDMDEAKLLLNAYYEALHGRLEAGKDLLARSIEKVLQGEIVKFGVEDFAGEKYAAYRDACLAFVDERMETYNPIGVQYTFDRASAEKARELELQLNWYDSTAEFEALMEAVYAKAEPQMTEERTRNLADELISELGAFPDKSIISTYRAGPGLGRLPDYVVAVAIEENIV